MIFQNQVFAIEMDGAQASFAHVTPFGYRNCVHNVVIAPGTSLHARSPTKGNFGKIDFYFFYGFRERRRAVFDGHTYRGNNTMLSNIVILRQFYFST